MAEPEWPEFMPPLPHWSLPSFWGHGIGPPPDGCDDPVRTGLYERYQELAAEAAERMRGLAQPGGGWLAVPDNPSLADGVCDVSTLGIRCNQPSAWHVWIGCTQEHLVEGFICAGHMERLERDSPRNWCTSCRKYNQDQQARPEPERQPPADERWQVLRKVEAQHDQPG
jgi:hypothetical protein